ncbi:protein transport protein bet1 [Coemansia linderi]|uniref:Protein transport protein bet1 n=1 Tax=Coemansia linderi TaxID=2663919 RepID=A0ACC1KKU4_9FUNG|nr:protein transport protein bet1 [Coemansia linderi]
MSAHNNQSNRLRHQAGLRSGTPGTHSGYSSAAYSGAGPEDDAAQQTYDDDPNGKDSRLKMKISMLKDVSITIGDEIRDQNQFLVSMGEDMDGLGGRLATTMKHFYEMWARQGCGPLFYLCLFAVCVFVFMYLYLKFR